MNTEPLHRTLTPHEYAALKIAARSRALQLRQEALGQFRAQLGNGLWSGGQAVARLVRRVTGRAGAGPRTAPYEGCLNVPGPHQPGRG